MCDGLLAAESGLREVLLGCGEYAFGLMGDRPGVGTYSDSGLCVGEFEGDLKAASPIASRM